MYRKGKKNSPPSTFTCPVELYDQQFKKIVWQWHAENRVDSVNESTIIKIIHYELGHIWGDFIKLLGNINQFENQTNVLFASNLAFSLWCWGREGSMSG